MLSHYSCLPTLFHLPLEDAESLVGVVAGVVGAVAIATGVTAGVVYATREVTTTIGVSVGDPP